MASLVFQQFPLQVIRMAGATENGRKTVFRFGLVHGRVWRNPVRVSLPCNGREHHFGCDIKIAHQVGFGFAAVRELLVAVPNVAGPGNLRSDVVIQVACEVKDEVPNAVAVRIRLAPELVGGKRRHQLLRLCLDHPEVISQAFPHHIRARHNWETVGLGSEAGYQLLCAARLGFARRTTCGDQFRK